MPDDDEMLEPDDQALLQDDAGEGGDREEGLLDKLRGGGVGTEDPTIVGEVGPTDIPPGTDGDAIRLATSEEPVDHLEV